MTHVGGVRVKSAVFYSAMIMKCYLPNLLVPQFYQFYTIIMCELFISSLRLLNIRYMYIMNIYKTTAWSGSFKDSCIVQTWSSCWQVLQLLYSGVFDFGWMSPQVTWMMMTTEQDDRLIKAQPTNLISNTICLNIILNYRFNFRKSHGDGIVLSASYANRTPDPFMLVLDLYILL